MKYMLFLFLALCLSVKAQFAFDGPEIGMYNYAIPTSILSSNVWPLNAGAGATRIDVNGNGLMAGMSFICASNITVFGLGATNVSATNVQYHVVALYTGIGSSVTTIVASVMLNFSNAGLGKFFANLTNPVVLPAGSTNFVGVSSSFGDRWLDVGTPTTNGSMRVLNGIFGNMTSYTNPGLVLNGSAPSPLYRAYAGPFIQYR